MRCYQGTGAIFMAALLTVTLSISSRAETWPSKPVRLIVPYPAGGTTDLTARLLSQVLAKTYSQQFIVENRPGAGANVGSEVVAKAAPDGYTFLLTSPGPLTTNQFLYKNLAFDPSKDFTPVVNVCDAAMVIAAGPKAPFTTLKGLIDYARSNPDKLTYASPGNGTFGHLAGELFKQMTGIKIVHVPYRGSAPALQDLMGGSVELAVDVLPIYIPHITSGAIRALGVTTAERWFALPDAPTVAEGGVTGYQVSAWIGMFGPAGLPKDIVGSLNRQVNAYLDSDDGSKRLRDLGYRPLGGPPEELEKVIREDITRWGPLIKQIGASVD